MFEAECFGFYAIFQAPKRAAAVTKTLQTIDSFGATSIAWANAPEEQDPAMYDAIVNYRGASGAHGAIWPNFEITNDNADPTVFNWAGFDSKQVGTVVTIASLCKICSTGLTIAEANFAGRLPDEHYRLTVAAGAFTDPNGRKSAAITVDFYVMAVLAQRYNAVLPPLAALIAPALRRASAKA